MFLFCESYTGTTSTVGIFLTILPLAFIGAAIEYYVNDRKRRKFWREIREARKAKEARERAMERKE